MKTILANLKSAVFNRETVTIAGGEFGPDELKELVSLIEERMESNRSEIIKETNRRIETVEDGQSATKGSKLKF